MRKKQLTVAVCMCFQNLIITKTITKIKTKTITKSIHMLILHMSLISIENSKIVII